jgi:hypothetical protein
LLAIVALLHVAASYSVAGVLALGETAPISIVSLLHYGFFKINICSTLLIGAEGETNDEIDTCFLPLVWSFPKSNSTTFVTRVINQLLHILRVVLRVFAVHIPSKLTAVVVAEWLWSKV